MAQLNTDKFIVVPVIKSTRPNFIKFAPSNSFFLIYEFIPRRRWTTRWTLYQDEIVISLPVFMLENSILCHLTSSQLSPLIVSSLIKLTTSLCDTWVLHCLSDGIQPPIFGKTWETSPIYYLFPLHVFTTSLLFLFMKRFHWLFALTTFDINSTSQHIGWALVVAAKQNNSTSLLSKVHLPSICCNFRAWILQLLLQHHSTHVIVLFN